MRVIPQATLLLLASTLTITAQGFDFGEMRGPFKGENWGGMPDGPSNFNWGGPSSWGMPNNWNMGNGNWGGNNWNNPWSGNGWNGAPWGGNGWRGPWSGNGGNTPWNGGWGGPWSGGNGNPGWGSNRMPWGAGEPYRPRKLKPLQPLEELPPLQDLPPLEERYPSRPEPSETAGDNTDRG